MSKSDPDDVALEEITNSNDNNVSSEHSTKDTSEQSRSSLELDAKNSHKDTHRREPSVSVSLSATVTKDTDPAAGKDTGSASEGSTSTIEVPVKDTKKKMTPEQKKAAMRSFAIVSLAYLDYTITDGAVRMVVLFHANNLGLSAFAIALMFTLYEFCGVITNLMGGFIGSRVGLRKTLCAGLVLQLVCLAGLAGWQDDWSLTTSVVFVALFQSLGGVAKDFVKLSGKSVTKVTVEEEGETNRLLLLVSRLTGLKNSFKGFGHFWGTLGIVFVGYIPSLAVLFGMIVIILPVCLIYLPDDLGKAKNRPKLGWHILKKGWNVNALSLARVFLFGSRDVWFEVALPIFLTNFVLWEETVVGLFMGIYIILYGIVQSSSPELVLKPVNCRPPLGRHTPIWSAMLAIPAMVMALAMQLVDGSDRTAISAVLVVGIVTYAFVFAVLSAVHSFLILMYSNKDKVAMTVGFYYMANAAGRLVGTLLGGALYEFAGDSPITGFRWCLWVSLIFAILSGLAALLLKPLPGERLVTKGEPETEAEVEKIR